MTLHVRCQRARWHKALWTMALVASWAATSALAQSKGAPAETTPRAVVAPARIPTVLPQKCPSGRAVENERCYLLVMEGRTPTTPVIGKADKAETGPGTGSPIAADSAMAPRMPSVVQRNCPKGIGSTDNECYLLVLDRRTQPTKPSSK